MEQMSTPAIKGQFKQSNAAGFNSEAELPLFVIKSRLDALNSKGDWISGTSKLTQEHIIKDLEELGYKIKTKV